MGKKTFVKKSEAVARLVDIEVDRVDLVKSPAVRQSHFAVKKSSEQNDEQLCQRIAEAVGGNGTWVQEITTGPSGSFAIVRGYDESAGYVSKRVPFTVTESNVEVHQEEARDVSLAWIEKGDIIPPTHHQEQPKATRPRLFKSGDTAPAGPFGSATPKETTVTQEQLEAAVAKAVKDVTERLEKMEQSVTEQPAQDANNAPDIEEAINKAVAGLNERLDRVEKARGLTTQATDSTTEPETMDTVQKSVSEGQRLFAGFWG